MLGHMVCFRRELVDMSDSALASAELSGSDQVVTLVGRVADDLINKCRVKLHRKMSMSDSDPPAPLVESLSTALQTSEAEALATLETPELSVGGWVSRSPTSIHQSGFAEFA